ncbi:MAG: hypothetical protein AB7P18_28495, partial [Candidatus Binatia bacterium]
MRAWVSVTRVGYKLENRYACANLVIRRVTSWASRHNARCFSSCQWRYSFCAVVTATRRARAQAQAQGKAKPEERTGMQTTALIVQVGTYRICLYYTGRRH